MRTYVNIFFQTLQILCPLRPRRPIRQLHRSLNEIDHQPRLKQIVMTPVRDIKRLLGFRQGIK